MINVEYIKFIPYDFTTQDTNYLLGVKDERISIEIKFKAEWQIQADDNTLADFSGQTIAIKDVDGDPVDGIWERNEFKIGDIITISGTASNNVTTGAIISFSADGSIATFAGSAFASETGSTSALLYGVTPLTGVSFKYNFIENDAAITFDSLIDGNENKYALQGISTATVAYVQTNHQGVYQSNKIGTVQIKSTGTLNEYIIFQQVNIVPFVLAGQLFDIQNSIAPEYYLDSSCLKYVYEISLHKTLLNPNFIHVTSPLVSLLGNAGNFNENFNAGPPEYSLVSTTFKDVSNNVIDAPDFSKVNKVEIVLNSASGLFAFADDRLYTIQHAYIPIDSTEYTNNSSDVETNFMFDQQSFITGGALVNGRGYGTDKQVLKNIQVVFVDANTVTVHAQLDLSDAYKTRLESLAGNFYLGVTTQTYGLATEVSDKVHVLASSIAYTVDLSDDAVGDITTDFISHPSTSTFTDTLSNAGTFVEDWQIGRSIFSVDYTNEATLKNINVRIFAINNTYGEFNLELKTFNVESVPVVSGIQVISITGERGYKMADGNMFNDYSILRRTDLDTGGFAFYELLYNFKIRWEDFIALPGVNDQFYDPAELQNGKNNEWSRYASTLGWSLKYEVSLTITKDDFDNTISSESDVTALDYGAATDWTYYTKSFDLETGNEITGNVMSDRDTIVKIYFTKTVGTEPDIDTVTGLIGIAPTEAGGDKVIREISLPHGKELTSPWVSITNDDLLKIEKVGVEYILSATLDFSKLKGLFPNATSFDITGRIEESVSGDAKAFGDGELFIFGDGQQYVFGL